MKKRKLKELKFTTLPITEASHQKRIEKSDDLRRALTINYTVEFIEDLKERYRKGLNCILHIFGLPGMGKSWAGLWIAMALVHLIKIKFSAVHVSFNRTQMLEKMETAKEAELYILDEGGTKEGGMGSSRERRQLDNILQVVRAKRIFFIIISPEPKDFIYHYALETWTIDDENSLAQLIIYARTHEKLLDPIGYIITGRPPQSLVDEYDIEKWINMENVLKGMDSDRMRRIEKAARIMLQDPYYSDPKSTIEWKKQLIREKFGAGKFTMDEVKAIIAKSQMMRYEEAGGPQAQAEESPDDTEGFGIVIYTTPKILDHKLEDGKASEGNQCYWRFANFPDVPKGLVKIFFAMEGNVVGYFRASTIDRFEKTIYWDSESWTELKNTIPCDPFRGWKNKWF